MPTRLFDIVDPKGLYAKFPHLFKIVPDYTAINRARAARFDLAPYVTEKTGADEAAAAVSTPATAGTEAAAAPAAASPPSPAPAAAPQPAPSQIHLETAIAEANAGGAQSMIAEEDLSEIPEFLR